MTDRPRPSEARPWPREPRRGLRILTANLWNGRADPAGFAELVAILGVDVAAVQELAPEQASSLEKVLPHGRLEPARDHRGMGLALRHPAPVEHVPLDYRPARAARLEPGPWPGLETPLEVLNVHVVSPHQWPLWRALARRRNQLRGLERYLGVAGSGARVLVGDLNATPLWPVYRRLSTLLRDAARETAARRGRRPARTWGPRPGIARLLRIDHVLVHGTRVEWLEVVPVRGSDHSAVVVELVREEP